MGADKKPSIRNWDKIGPKISSRLVEKFPHIDAFGFPLGARSGVTVLDIDTKDATLLNDTQSRYGESPFIVETGGGYHAYYRYGGEGRLIKPWGAETPIDVLGSGFAVAAPSRAAKGRYKIIHGTLDDLKNLPPLRVTLDELRKPIPSGKRNTTLFHIGLQQAGHTDDFETLLDVMRTRNMDCEIPLPDSEVIKAAESAWKYQIEGRNLVGKGHSVLKEGQLVITGTAATQSAPEATSSLLNLRLR